MMRLLIYALNLIFVMILGWIVSRILSALLGSQTGGRRTVRSSSARPEIRGQTARDPVCGMFVSTEVSHRLEHDGRLLHFCSPECLHKFRSEVRHS
jgi:YHS domain-containing protein